MHALEARSMDADNDWHAPQWYRFVHDEAALLDERGFVAWVDLFAPDGRYWMPTHAQAREDEYALALFDEPKDVLMLRAKRLLHPMTHVQMPASRTHHHVNGVRLLRQDDHGCEVQSMQWIVEQRAGVQRHFSARVLHRLRHSPHGMKIALKRVDLIDADAAHRALPFPL
jgi:3-phenylpropionate/cinnamic acid dioxygenase small subunit